MPSQLSQLTFAVARAMEHRRLVMENEAFRLQLEHLVADKTRPLKEALSSLTQVHSATLDTLSMALDFRDQSTSGHSKRVAELTAGAARSMGVTGEELVQIQHGALHHPLETGCRLRVFGLLDHQCRQIIVDVLHKCGAQHIDIDIASPHDLRRIGIVNQCQQEMLQGGIFVVALARQADRPVQGLFKATRQ